MGIETVGLAPPLTIDVATADRMVEILATAIEAMEAHLMPTGEVERREHVSDPREFFEEVLPASFDSSRAEGIEMTVQIVLDDEIWLLSISEGALEVTEPPQEQPGATCTIRMSKADYLKLVNGELGGDQAFVTGKLAFEGDMDKATQLLTLGIL